MSFKADYVSAYRVLRAGRTDPAILDRVLYHDYGMDFDSRRQDRERLHTQRLDVFSKIGAAIGAVRLAFEMRRQRVLIGGLMNEVDDTAKLRPVEQRPPVNILPITVNRTVIKVVDREEANEVLN